MSVLDEAYGDRLREAAVAICRLWFTDNAPDGSQHLRKAMLDLRDALDALPATPAASAAQTTRYATGGNLATPAASGDVDAAWNALLWDVGDTQGREAVIARHRPLIEAAIRAERGDVTIRDALAFDAGVKMGRAESAGLDVERLSSLVLAALAEWTGEPSDGVSAAIRRAIASKVAAEYARLAEPTP